MRFTGGQSRLGVGTTAPTSALHVKSNSASEVPFKVDSAVSLSTNIAEFSNYGSQMATITGNGNLGIGVTTPDNKLAIINGNPSKAAISVQAASSQNTNLMEFRTDDGSQILAAVSKDGVMDGKLRAVQCTVSGSISGTLTPATLSCGSNPDFSVAGNKVQVFKAGLYLITVNGRFNNNASYGGTGHRLLTVQKFNSSGTALGTVLENDKAGYGSPNQPLNISAKEIVYLNSSEQVGVEWMHTDAYSLTGSTGTFNVVYLGHQ